MPSVQRGARRPDQQLYIPGRGLLSKGSKSEEVVPVAEKKSNLQSVSSKQVNSACCEGFTGASNLKRPLKTRRPDIQVYVPKAKLLASRVNEFSHSSLNILSQGEKESQEVKASSSCCNSQNSPDVKIIKQHLKIEDNSADSDKQYVDFPTQKSTSWADHVEEYLSNSIQLNEELVDDSLDADRSKESNLVSNVDCLESVYSSGYSSSSNEDLKFMEPKTSDFNEVDSPHSILRQNQENSEFNSLVQGKHDIEEMVKSEGGVCDEQIAFLEKLLAGDKPIKIKKSLLAQILPCEAPLFPVRVEDEEKIRRREEILDRQIAFFDKLAAKAKSAEPKERVSVPVVPREAPLFPGRENGDFPQILEKREHIVEQQIDTFDKMLVKPGSERSQKTNVFQRLEIPNSFANPKMNTVPYQELPLNVPYTELDHIFCAPEDLNSHYSPATLDNDLYTEVSLPFNAQCTKFEHTFCALENLNSYHSPVTFNADLYTEVSLPFSVSSSELDHSFCAPGCSYSPESLVSLDADLYIPPPLPLNRPRSKVDHNFPAPEYLKSYSLPLDDFYAPAPRPLT
ncbi:uncharacterized protein [Parasteatoda tepidariorum]|uniref:uncharacterized protein n=1 Tax=Parasteatoda tepidariorum TaxID=114398 RepID=UPI00077F80D7|nr:uncharacterized protein LOC107447445 [Parasteatoda tepidariorum]